MYDPRPWLSARRTGRGSLLLVLVLLTGCSAVAERLGMRIRLEHVPVTALSAHLDTRKQTPVNALGPGESARLVVIATDQDGKQYVTVGAENGKVGFDNYTITPAVVQLGRNGTVSLPEDPRLSDGKSGHLHIAAAAHPDVATDLDIPLRYDLPFLADFSGTDGFRGMDGADGLDGSRGSDGEPAKIDPVTLAPGTPGAGGRGSDGGDGADGTNGQDGGPGGAVLLWVRLASTTPPILQVKATSGRREFFFKVDPRGGSLKVLANGGQGGAGGKGGRGGRGGDGGSGFPSGSRGLDGHDGLDGHAGQPGAAGTITVSVDPDAQPYLSCLTLVNRNGWGSPGRQPMIKVEAVPQLW